MLTYSHGIKCVLIMSLLFILINEKLNAQNYLKKNAYNFGGSISFAFSDTDNLDDEATTKDISVAPSFTYFVSDNLSIGMAFQFDYQEDALTHQANDSLISRTVDKFLNVGPTARYYFHTRNFAPFIETSVQFTTFLHSNDHGIAFSIGTGINYFITKSIALEPHVIYSWSKFFSPNYSINKYMFGIRIFYQIND